VCSQTWQPAAAAAVVVAAVVVVVAAAVVDNAAVVAEVVVGDAAVTVHLVVAVAGGDVGAVGAVVSPAAFAAAAVAVGAAPESGVPASADCEMAAVTSAFADVCAHKRKNIAQKHKHDSKNNKQHIQINSISCKPDRFEDRPVLSDTEYIQMIPHHTWHASQWYIHVTLHHTIGDARIAKIRLHHTTPHVARNAKHSIGIGIAAQVKPNTSVPQSHVHSQRKMPKHKTCYSATRMRKYPTSVYKGEVSRIPNPFLTPFVLPSAVHQAKKPKDSLYHTYVHTCIIIYKQERKE